jgi:hypothetical protein
MTDKDNYVYEETLYGFRWGPVYVERACSDEKGGVVIRIATGPIGESKNAVHIRVSPKGRTLTVEDIRK